MVNLRIPPPPAVKNSGEISKRNSVFCGLNVSRRLVLWNWTLCTRNSCILRGATSAISSVRFHWLNGSNLLPSTALLWRCSRWRLKYLAYNRVSWYMCTWSAAVQYQTGAVRSCILWMLNGSSACCPALLMWEGVWQPCFAALLCAPVATSLYGTWEVAFHQCRLHSLENMFCILRQCALQCR